MSRKSRRNRGKHPSRLAKVGLPPGTVVHVGPERSEPVSIGVFVYDRQGFCEKQSDDVEAALAMCGDGRVRWLNVDGLHRTEVIEKVGRHFNIHPLVLEDIAHTTQRPKVEQYGDSLFVVARMLRWSDDADDVIAEQVSFVLGQGYLITFQENPGDVFDLIRDRIRNDKGHVRSMGADYLLYALLDSIVDYYFVVLERIGDRVEELEDRELDDPSPQILRSIREVKKRVASLRRSCWPMREMVARLGTGQTSLISPDISLYLRDLYDHSAQVLDTVETYRDTLAGVMEIYLSSVSNRMNEVMKVLTIIATIFIPLTFIAGVYGMNFKLMPELGWYLGYPLVLAAMAIVALGMLLFFRRKGWI